VLALSASARKFGPDTGVVLHGFQTRGAGGKNKTPWELSGAKATIREGFYELEDFKVILHLEDGSEAVLTSPACKYDESRGVAESNAPIRVESDAMTLEGIGYDVLLEEKKLRVRSNVRMTIRREGGLSGVLRESARSAPGSGNDAEGHKARQTVVPDSGEK
jgi:hypothetical protein